MAQIDNLQVYPLRKILGATYDRLECVLLATDKHGSARRSYHMREDGG